MAQILEIDLRDIILSNSSFGPREIKLISQAISDDYTQFGQLRDVIAQLAQDENLTPATAVKLGVGYYLLGEYQKSINTLSNADSGAVAFFYLGKSYFSLAEYEKAMTSYESAIQAGYEKDICLLGIVEAKRQLNDAAGAMRLLDDMFGPIEQTAEYLYQRGTTIAAIGDNPMEVIALYERAVEIDDSHAGAMFGLALENDRRGNDSKAIELYRRAANIFPSNVGTLLNLGVLYEDNDQYDLAQRCYKRILEVFPNHGRAKLGQFAHEVQEEEEPVDTSSLAPHEQAMLDRPISDLNLSVRARKCMNRLGMATIGELIRKSGDDLLECKNFGVTSLNEVREKLVQLGVKLRGD